jgi:hypothetical protein
METCKKKDWTSEQKKKKKETKGLGNLKENSH